MTELEKAGELYRLAVTPEQYEAAGNALRVAEAAAMAAEAAGASNYQTYYQLSWYDPTSGSWFDFGDADDQAGVAELVERLTQNARPYPCPTYRVSYSVTYEVHQ